MEGCLLVLFLGFGLFIGPSGNFSAETLASTYPVTHISMITRQVGPERLRQEPITRG